MTPADKIAHYIDSVFPLLAVEYNWPIRFDHCFRRVIYDNCIGERWDAKIPAPAIKNMTVSQLANCIRICEEIVKDPQLMIEYNNRSLDWRKK